MLVCCLVCGCVGWVDKFGCMMKCKGVVLIEVDFVDMCVFKVVVNVLFVLFGVYGVWIFGDYEGVGGICFEVFELFSVFYNGEMCFVCCFVEGIDVGCMLFYKWLLFGFDVMEVCGVGGMGVGGSDFVVLISFKDYFDIIVLGFVDVLLWLFCELVLIVSYVFIDC